MGVVDIFSEFLSAISGGVADLCSPRAPYQSSMKGELGLIVSSGVPATS
jgi:hypothetical protein